MMGMVGIVGWAVAILLAMIGWGALVRWIVLPRWRYGWGVKAVLGVAALIVLGGGLNYLGLISPGLVQLIVGGGILLLALDVAADRRGWAGGWQRWHEAWRCSPAARLIWVVAIILIGGQLVASAASRQFNEVDDYHGYFVFPTKMLQTGSMGDDPFSERRVQSIGGHNFLNALVLANGRVENLYLIDPGIGLVLAAGVLGGYLSRRGVRPMLTASAIIVLALLPPPVINATATMIPLAMFLALFVLMDDARLRHHGARRAVALAAVAAPLATLKTSLLPVIGLLFVAAYAMRLARRRSPAVVGECALCGLAGTLLITPWMLAMYSSSGTLLYPVLGRGYHATGWGTVATPTEAARDPLMVTIVATMTHQVFMALCVATLALLVLVPRWSTRGCAALALAVASLAGGLIMSWAVAGEGSYRYGYPFYVAAILAVLATLLINHRHRAAGAVETPQPQPSAGMGIGAIGTSALLAGFLVGALWSSTVNRAWDLWDNLRFGLAHEPIASAGQATALRRAQEAIPAAEPFLARVDKPYLLDFQRNEIFVADHPGSVSPPPGMPLYEGPEAVAEYLRAVGLHHIMYGYGNEAGFARRDWGYMLDPDHPRARTLMGLVAGPLFDFQDNVLELGRRYRRVFDDGQTFVLDLTEAVQPEPAASLPDAPGGDAP